jgi:hypothetical protein
MQAQDVGHDVVALRAGEGEHRHVRVRRRALPRALPEGPESWR